MRYNLEKKREEKRMLITLKNVVKKFDTFTALNHLTMQVRKGSIYGLVGPNGSRKNNNDEAFNRNVPSRRRRNII